MSSRFHRSWLPRTVVALGFTSFFTDAASDMIFPLLPTFVVALGAGPAWLGAVEGVADATSSILKLASGYVADRPNRKKRIVLLGYSIATVVRPLMALASAPWHVLAVRVTDRLGKGIRSAPRDALLAASVPASEAGRAFGFQRALDHAGAVVGPLIASALLHAGFTLRQVFLCAVIPGLLSVACVLLVPEPEAPLVTQQRPEATERQRMPAGFKNYLAVLTVFSLANSSDAFLLLRARELGISLEQIPLLWTSLHVSKLVSAYVGGRLSDQWPRWWGLTAGWLLYAGAYSSLSFSVSGSLVWGLFAIYGCFHGLTEPAEKAFVRDLVHASLHGRAYGYYYIASGMTAIPAAVLTGVLWQHIGAAFALRTCAAIAAAAALILFMTFASDRRTGIGVQ